MKTSFSLTVFVLLFGLLTAADVQTLEIKRGEAAYHPEEILDPSTLLSPATFGDTESGRYVVVEGYIDYVATTWPEADGDYHFEMQTTNKPYTKNPIDGLVCEIHPTLQLDGFDALRKIDQHNPTTYRRVRVWFFAIWHRGESCWRSGI